MIEYIKEAELRVMNIFWQNNDDGLTKGDVLQHCEKLKYPYQKDYVRNTVKRLEKRGFIKIVGTRKGSTRFAYVYKPLLSKAEFWFSLADLNENEVKELITLCNDFLTNRT
jgi:predicted transcriptional regulator